MASITPNSFNRRSPVYRELSAASFIEIAGAATAADFANGKEQAEQSGLLDMSTVPRAGLRGSSAAEHLQLAGFPVPSQPNQAVASDAGELVLRLGQKEYWILGSFENHGDGIGALLKHELPQTGCYPLYCQDSHAWFALTGWHLPEILAKMCGVDLRTGSFPVGAIVQTSLARINAILVNYEMSAIPCFHVLCDSASAEYLWGCLLDAMAEFGGEPVGVETLNQ